MKYLKWFICVLGSCGTLLVFFGSIFYYLGKKRNSVIGTELNGIVTIAGVCLHPLFLTGSLKTESLIAGLITLFLLTILIIPLRGISFQTSMTKDEIIERLRKSMTFTEDGPSSCNPKVHRMITHEGVMIVVKSVLRDKSREVFVVCGINLKKAYKVKNEVLKALHPVKDLEKLSKNNLASLMLGTVFLIIYIISRITGIIA